MIVKGYNYTAIDSKGEKIKGRNLFKKKLELIKELKEKDLKIVKYKKSIYLDFNYRLTFKDLELLSRNLSILLSSGLLITNSINIILKQTKNKVLKEVLKEVYDSLIKGNSLSNSISKYYSIFPPMFVEIIDIGEQSGNLEKVLNDLSTYYKKKQIIKSKITSVVAYPLILILTAISVTLFIFTNVFPSLVSAISSINLKLPFVTTFLLNISKFIKEKFIYFILFPIFSIYLARLFLIKRKISLTNFICLKFFNKYYEKIILISFCRNLSLLLSSGISIIKALEIVKKINKEGVLFHKINLSIEKIKRGKSLEEAFSESGFNNSVFLSLLSVGEEGGKLDVMLKNCSEVMEDELNASFKTAVTFIEPILIIFIGALISALIILLLNPLMNLLENIN